MFSDTLRLAMIMPFVLWRFLSPEHLKTAKLNALKTEMNLSQRNGVCRKLLELWSTEAKALRLVFKTSFEENDYNRLHEVLNRERDALLEVSFVTYRDSSLNSNAEVIWSDF